MVGHRTDPKSAPDPSPEALVWGVRLHFSKRIIAYLPAHQQQWIARVADWRTLDLELANAR
eukprot:2209355-Alexandrium_andersonii.AAC.1